ncbi:hypothetical protein ACHAXA_008431 [Cyclostephanos tholiformis]|uniref:Uncharacterized protein n=1 Tax=Cyclostephanos tholiformis TaxID=382380 RepID=A0ABD3SBJ5_9STRA
MDDIAVLSPRAISIANSACSASAATTEEAEIRIEKTKDLLRKFDEQKSNLKDQSQRPIQQRTLPLRAMKSIKMPSSRIPFSKDAAGNRRMSLSPKAVTRMILGLTESKDFPTGVEDTDQVYCGNRENSDTAVVVGSMGSKNDNTPNDYYAGDDIARSHPSIDMEDTDQVYCGNKENADKGAVEHAGKHIEKTKELLLMFSAQKKNWKEQSQRPLQQLRAMPSSKDAGNYRTSLSPKAVTRKILESTESKDFSTGVEDTDQVYCVKSEETFDIHPTLVDVHTTSTDSAESTGSSLSMVFVRKLKGVEETQPLGGAKYYIMVNTKKGQAKIVHEAMPASGKEGFTSAMEEKGYEIIEYDFLPEEENGLTKEVSKVFDADDALNKVLDVAEQIDDALNKVLDVAERIDNALTGCYGINDKSFDCDDNQTAVSIDKSEQERT